MYRLCSVLPPPEAPCRTAPRLWNPLFSATVFAIGLLFSLHAYSQAPSTPVPSTFFGMTSIVPSSEYPTVSIGNFGKESAAEWGYIEPNAPTGGGCPGTANCAHTYNWSTLDSYVSTAAAHGIPFMWTWDYAPSWATGGAGCGSSARCTGNITDLADMDAFVQALVTRYDGNHGHGTIQAYETGNEVWSSGGFTGTMSQLVTIINRMVRDIRAANPNAKVGGPVGEGAPDYYYVSGGKIDQFFAAGGTKDFNFITFHGYPHHSDDSPEYLVGSCVPSGSSDGHGEVACIKAMMARNGIPSSTPIWMTEGGWADSSYSNCVNRTGGGSSTTGCENTTNNVLKQAFVSRYMLEMWSAGVSRANWYDWGNRGWGTLCVPGSCGATTAASAWQQVYNWMVGSTMTTPCAIESGSIWTCGLTLSGGTQALAVWNTSGSSGYPVPSAYTQYSDLSGNTNSAGSSVTIDITPILLRGGVVATAPKPPTSLRIVVQ
ncbi:MAG: hypothetical protein DMG76_03200 [Acidobacteria bacterium]|nr:MAG: hypothetical protein DMG76_03200 [Acidobacteriota bacterium]